MKKLLFLCSVFALPLFAAAQASSKEEAQRQWAQLDSTLLARKAQCNCCLESAKTTKQVFVASGTSLGAASATAAGIVTGVMSDSSAIKETISLVTSISSAVGSTTSLVTGFIMPKKKIEAKEDACSAIDKLYEKFSAAKPNFDDEAWLANFESQKADFSAQAEKLGEFPCGCSEAKMTEKYGYPATSK